MVAMHEAEPTRAELFHRELADHQQGYLRALAGAAQQAETTSLKEDAALKVVGAVNVRLRDAGLVGRRPMRRRYSIRWWRRTCWYASAAPSTPSSTSKFRSGSPRWISRTSSARPLAR